MKRIIVLAITMVTMLVSLSGCFWGYPERGRGEGHDRREDGGYNRGDDHDRDHDRERDGGQYERR